MPPRLIECLGQNRFAMAFSALVTLLVTAAPQALGQPLLASPLLAVIREDAPCEVVRADPVRWRLAQVSLTP